jgi:hypothetical protein
LLADYLFAEPTTADTPGIVAYFKAGDNATESPTLENDVGTEANRSVAAGIPATLESKRVAPTEFMLFLVCGCLFLTTTVP